MYKFKVKLWKYTKCKPINNIREKYKDRINDYMNVYIYDNYEEMYKSVNKIENSEEGKDYLGRTLCYTRVYTDENKDIVKIGNICGNIYLCVEDLSSYVVTHECGHAVLGYIDRHIKEKHEIFNEYKEYQIVEDNNIELEELFCYMLGSICSQINEFISKNIIDEYYVLDKK